MSFANLKTDASIEKDVDSVGPSSGPVPSALYPGTISMAYYHKADSGALAVVVHLKSEDGRDIRNTVYVTSGDAKGNHNYYEKDGQKKYLPGFSLINGMCLLTTGKELGDLVPEEKTIKIYDFKERKEVNTAVPVLTELLGKPVIAGVLRQIEDKNVKNDQGVYVPSGETRVINEIDKFFKADNKLTTAEILAGATDPGFYATWGEKWNGVDKDRSTKGVTPPAAGAAPAAGGAAPKPTTSLFATS